MFKCGLKCVPCERADYYQLTKWVYLCSGCCLLVFNLFVLNSNVELEYNDSHLHFPVADRLLLVLVCVEQQQQRAGHGK